MGKVIACEQALWGTLRSVGVVERKTRTEFCLVSCYQVASFVCSKGRGGGGRGGGSWEEKTELGILHGKLLPKWSLLATKD